MQKRRHKVWLLVGATVITVMLTFATCGQGQPSISREEAINIARQAVEEDGVMSLAGRDTEAVEEADYWHICFPYTLHERRGGEPHVLVDKSNGEVIRIYYTQ